MYNYWEIATKKHLEECVNSTISKSLFKKIQVHSFFFLFFNSFSRKYHNDHRVLSKNPSNKTFIFPTSAFISFIKEWELLHDLAQFCLWKWFFQLSCHSRFQHAFTACICVFKVITLVGLSQSNYFANTTTCSKRMLKTTVATQINSKQCSGTLVLWVKVGFNQSNYFENTTAFSKRMLKMISIISKVLKVMTSHWWEKIDTSVQVQRKFSFTKWPSIAFLIEFRTAHSLRLRNKIKPELTATSEQRPSAYRDHYFGSDFHVYCIRHIWTTITCQQRSQFWGPVGGRRTQILLYNNRSMRCFRRILYPQAGGCPMFWTILSDSSVSSNRGFQKIEES